MFQLTLLPPLFVNFVFYRASFFVVRVCNKVILSVADIYWKTWSRSCGINLVKMASKIAMTSLDAGLSLISTIGNGSFMAIFVRFKNLRNFPNILLANLAAVDFLNAVINVPMHTLNYVWKSSWMKGKTPAVISSSLQLEFALLNMVSMFAIMLDRFLA